MLARRKGVLKQAGPRAAGRLGLLALVFSALFCAPALAQSDDEIEFARGIVKARLEVDRTGSEYRWTNPDSGNSASMTILETQILPGNLPCRWYRWSMDRSGGDLKVEGKGCRLSNGDWLLEETAIITRTRRVEVPVSSPAPTPVTPQPAAEPEPEPAAAPSADPLESIDFTLPPRSAEPAGSDAQR